MMNTKGKKVKNYSPKTKGSVYKSFKTQKELADSGNNDIEECDDGISNIRSQRGNEMEFGSLKRRSVPANNDAEGTAIPKKPKIIEKVKPPTLEEINELKETRNLFHSNLFRLQVKEMLTELKVKEKYKNYINGWVDNFKAFCRELKSSEDKEDMNSMEWLLSCSLKVPIALQQLRVQKQKIFKFQFIAPTDEPELIGAAATHTLIGPRLVADVRLSIPAEFYQKDNFLNLVYDQKRAYYLTYIAKELPKSKHFVDLTLDHLQFNYYANNPLKPVLEIIPPSSCGSIAKKVLFRIFVAAEEKVFKLSRFVPWNSNIRASLFNNNEDEETSLPLATPNYNANVLFDLTMEKNQKILHDIFEQKKNFQEGLILLKVWLKQRQFNVGFSGFHTHMISMFIAYLSKQGKLHANMSSYQIARTVWNQLGHSSWDEDCKGISLCDSLAQNQPTLEQFHAHYDVVFVDATGFYNICANLSVEMYRRVRSESKIAVDMLNDMRLNSFQYLFMTKCPLYVQFDHILKINKADAIEQILEMHVTPGDKYNYTGHAFPQLLKVVTGLLRKGLGKRVYSLAPIECSQESWPVVAESKGCGEYLHLGVILNPEEAYEVLDKGPESIAEGADEFRKFWGDKAQLRRFQDGSITESVVWAQSSDTLTKKRLVVRSIIIHLLEHHFQLEAKDIEYISSEFDVAYRLTPAFKTDKLIEHFMVDQDTDSEAVSLSVIRSFDDLTRKLLGLKDLPLEIVSIAGISPVFHYCEPVPVLQTARSINGQFYATSVQRGVLQLGLSGKWPGELTALHALKVAFYIQISKLLREKHHLKTKVTNDGVLILKQGYCFNIEIAHPKELALLKKEKTEKGITRYVDCSASVSLEKRHYILPKVSGALHALYQLQPSFGPAVMIAKRWLHSQLIDDGLWPDECTELLIASQYMYANGQHITCSPQKGFLRFLHLLANTDWKTELVILNFNNSMDENEIADLEYSFNAERDSFPPLSIITAYDQQHYGMLWSTKLKPNENVIARVTILARQALDIIEMGLLSPNEELVKPSKLFTASSQGYDLVIRLKPDLVPNTLCFDFGSPFVPFGKPNWRLPLAGTDFLMDALQNLREAYSEFAVFFHNQNGGKEIAIVWKPDVFNIKEFKVNDVNGCAPVSNGDGPKRIQCHKETLIEDFKIILKDFYLSIDTTEALVRSVTKPEPSTINHTKRYFSKPLEENSRQKVTVKNNPKFGLISTDIKKNKLQHKLNKNASGKYALKKNVNKL